MHDVMKHGMGFYGYIDQKRHPDLEVYLGLKPFPCWMTVHKRSSYVNATWSSDWILGKVIM